MARRKRNDKLFNLYLGAAAGSPVKTGQSQAGISAGIQALGQVQRAHLLEQNLKSGAVKPESLSLQDQTLLGNVTSLSPKKLSPGGDGGGGVGGFFSHLLGERGLGGALLHLPQGLATTASDVAGIAKSFVSNDGDPDKAVEKFKKDIVEPVVEGYKYSYGPLVHGDFGKFARHFYEQPLGPVLDVAAVASGGTTAAARVATRVGSGEGRLASVISREGRAPVSIQSHMQPRAIEQLGESVPEIPRLYSPRPLRHIAQASADKLVASGAGTKPLPLVNKSLQDISQLRAINRWTDRAHAQRVLEGQMRARLASNSFVKSLNGLNAAEQTALHFALRGINDRALLSVAQDYWKKSLDGQNPEGHNLSDFAGVPEEYVQHLAHLPESVIERIEHPTQNMVDAANLWHAAVEEGRTELGVDDYVHAKNVVATQRALRGLSEHEMGTDEIERVLHGDLEDYLPPPNKDGVEYPIRPSYVPDMPASNMKFGQQRAGALSFLARRLGTSGKEYVLSPGERKIRVIGSGPETLIRPPFQAYLKTSDLSTFHSGAFRTDAKALVDHITRRETDLVDQVFNQGLVDRLAIRDEDGEVRSFKNQGEVDHATGGGYQFIPLDGSVRWFRAEDNVLKETIKRIEDLDGQGSAGTPEMINQLNRLLDNNAREFVRNMIGAVKNPGVAVPVEFAKRMEAIAKSSEPFMGAFYRRALNKWRTLTLAYMPRWWINTAVGSAFLNFVKGVWNPRDYIEAKRLMGSGKLPAGVQLGGFAEHELLEGPSGLLTARAPTRAIYRMVENTESYFRTASFVHSLKKEQKRAMRGIGDVLSGYKPIMRDDRSHGAYIEGLLENPTLVEHALDDVNRFAYNMTELGPIERKYVRSFIPFWGWYKFITKLVWRLPVEYPGRALVLTQLGNIGEDQEEQLGLVPDWMKGSIFLNRDRRALAFLPTRGLNPFAQFANPFSDEGTVQGLLHWGQLAPPFQAAIQGAGVDTLTGGPSEISPDEHVGFDFWGNPIDLANGKPLSNVGQRASLRRGIATLLRSVPQYRLGEQWFEGGNPVYPESIPFIGDRPKGVRPETRRQFSPVGALSAYSGFNPRTTNLKRSQELTAKQIEYARTANRRRKKNEQKSLRKEP